MLFAIILVGAAGPLHATTAAAAVASADVTPQQYTATMEPGQSVTITKTVTTPPIPPNPDIVFLADTTTSMIPAIENVQDNAGTIVSEILDAQPTAEFAVADYKDSRDPEGDFFLRQQLTGDATAVTNGIDAWTPLSGGWDDAPEDWIGALAKIPTAIDFRANGTPVLVMFGDASSHDPSDGATLASATSALQAAGIRVIAISIATPEASDGLDSEGQATYVTSRTGGTLTGADPDQVASTILERLQNLPAEVTHQAQCDDGLTATLDPASQTVTSGGAVTFEETISLARDAREGQTVHCTVTFAVNGQAAGPEFVQSVAVRVKETPTPTPTPEPSPPFVAPDTGSTDGDSAAPYAPAGVGVLLFAGGLGGVLWRRLRSTI